MRFLYITKEQFDDFLYPSFASRGPEDEIELEIAARTKEQFKAVASYELISEDRKVEAINRGMKLVPFLKLNSPSIEMSLEEDQYRLIVKMVKAYIPRITNAASDEFFEFYKKVTNAPTKNGSASATEG